MESYESLKQLKDPKFVHSCSIQHYLVAQKLDILLHWLQPLRSRGIDGAGCHLLDIAVLGNCPSEQCTFQNKEIHVMEVSVF